MSESKPLIINMIGDEDEQQMFERSNKNNEPCMGSCLDCLGTFFGCFCLVTSCGCCCNPYKTVKKGYRGVITRFGSIKQIVSDGLHYVNPISEDIRMADLMLHVKKLANQSVLTKDNLPITIDGAVYYYINNTPKDIVKANYGVFNVSFAVDELAHSTLRLVFGKHTLQECLEKRQDFAKEMKNIIGEQANR